MKSVLNLPEWQSMNAAAATGAGVCLCSDLRNNEDRDPFVYSLQSATAFYRYLIQGDGWQPLASPALGGTFGAGAEIKFAPSAGPYGTLAAGCSTTSIILSTALPAAVGVNQLANRGDKTGFKVRVIGNAAGSSGKIEERWVVTNTAGTAPTLTLDAALSFTPVAGDGYEFLSGAVFLLNAGAIANNILRKFDVLTNSYLSMSYSNLPTIGTASEIEVHDELHVPFSRAPGEGIFGQLIATATGAATITGQATGGDAGLVLNGFRNFQIRIVEDTAIPTSVGQRRKITSHTAGASPVYTLLSPWTVQPSANAKFVIEQNNDLLLWTGTSQVTYSYQAGFNPDAPWSFFNYSSNFSEGVNGWLTTNGTLAANNDSILSKDDCLKYYGDATNGNHIAYVALSTVIGRSYKIQLSVYVPNTQTNVDGFALGDGTNYLTGYGTSGAGNSNHGSWVDVSIASFTATNTNLYIYLLKAATVSFACVNSPNDDRIYIKDVVITPLPYNVYTSNFSAGVDGWAADSGVISGNEDGITDDYGVTKNNCLKYYGDAVGGVSHGLIRSGTMVVGTKYRFQCWVYVPSGQTNIDGFDLYPGEYAQNYQMGSSNVCKGYLNNGRWNYIDTCVVATIVNCYIWGQRGIVNYPYACANNPNDDRIYITGVVITEQPTGGATPYLNLPANHAAGAMVAPCWGLVEDAAKTVRNSWNYLFRGGATNIDVFDIAAGANGYWTTSIPHGGRGLRTTGAGSSCVLDPISNSGKLAYQTDTACQRYFRWNCQTAVLEAFSCLRYIGAGAVEGNKLALSYALDAATKTSWLYRAISPGTDFFRLPINPFGE